VPFAKSVHPPIASSTKFSLCGKSLITYPHCHHLPYCSSFYLPTYRNRASKTCRRRASRIEI